MGAFFNEMAVSFRVCFILLRLVSFPQVPESSDASTASSFDMTNFRPPKGADAALQCFDMADLDLPEASSALTSSFNGGVDASGADKGTLGGLECTLAEENSLAGSGCYTSVLE